jgi:hypothetical protein
VVWRCSEHPLTITEHSLTISEHSLTISEHSLTIGEYSLTISEHSLTIVVPNSWRLLCGQHLWPDEKISAATSLPR